MRSRRSAHEQVAEVARRRLELLSAELAEIRPDPVDTPVRRDRGGSGEPPGDDGPAWRETPTPEPSRRDAPVQGAGPGRHAHRPVGLVAGVSGWAQDRLPPTLQGRVRMSSAHLVVVACLVLAGAAVTAWWVTRADGPGQALPPVASTPSVPPSVTGGPVSRSPAAPTASTASGAAASGGAAATGPAGSVVVDVAGKVRRPGIATLPAGSRVVDALKAAGGAKRGVPLGSLNLARVLADGEQIVVGVRSPPGVAATAAAAPTAAGGSGTPMVNVNTATQAQLEELPGIGPVTARSILDFRAENGTFTSVDELLEVKGIGDATLADIAPFVTL
jgi:competence protein ComEA